MKGPNEKSERLKEGKRKSERDNKTKYIKYVK